MKNYKKIFFEKLEIIINSNELIKLIISNKRDKKSDLKKIIIKLVKIKKGLQLSFVYNHKTKDVTKNFNIDEGINIVKNLLDVDFLNADLFATNETIQLIINKKGKEKLQFTESKIKKIPKLNHDRKKTQKISTKNNIYLQELGITAKNGNVKKNKEDKLRQINKYLETFEALFNDIKDKTDLQIVDMGSGKGYLTFALYDYLTNNLEHEIRVTGVEYRQELVDKCNKIVEKSGFEKLNFKSGTIENSEFEKIDILIALHACDTATDDAIYKGIMANSELIVVAPCCQKQIRKQMNVPNQMNSILKHGILEERQAELLTDGIRALILEMYGYKTKVFEFISNEHTAKNVMITASKNSQTKNNNEILEKIDSIKSFYGIKYHYLETLLEKKSTLNL